jgi:hypothetical protein
LTAWGGGGRDTDVETALRHGLQQFETRDRRSDGG